MMLYKLEVYKDNKFIKSILFMGCEQLELYQYRKRYENDGYNTTTWKRVEEVELDA